MYFSIHIFSFIGASYVGAIFMQSTLDCYEWKHSFQNYWTKIIAEMP